jgi:uncharacterized protein DUF6962
MFNSSSLELATGVTDFVLGVLSLYVIFQLRRYPSFKARIWIWAFGLLTAASILGFIAHGFSMSAETNNLIWQPLNLALGLTLGFFVVGAVFDLFREGAARRMIPVMLILGVAFYLVTVLVPGTFMTFIAYEGVAMLFALGGYAYLSTKKMTGALSMTFGVLVTIVAAAIQAMGKPGESMIWYFDHNGLFHIIQFVGILFLLNGLKTALDVKEQRMDAG